MLKGFVSRIALLASWLGVFAVPAQAADYGAFNQAYANRLVLPAFRTLAERTGTLAREADGFAATPDQARFAALRAAFDGVSDAWMQAEFFRQGPLGEEQRADRIAYWPERRNIVDRQLATLLAAPPQDPPVSADLAAEEFSHSSVAVQGLPALERLLYGDAARQVLSAGPEQKARIAAIQAIAHNLDTLAHGLLQAWEQVLAAPGTAASPFAQDPGEATTGLYTGIVFIMQILDEHKIAAPNGAAIDQAKPKLSEQWRSGRSLRNIRLNLDAAREAVLGPEGFQALMPAGSEALKTETAKAFDAAIAAAKAAPEPLDAAVTDPDGRKKIDTLLAAVNELTGLLKNQVPQAVGITLGFNELDGDGS
jgi:hypothetical protein